MRWGFGHSCFWGDPENEIIILGETDLGSGVAVTFIVIPDHAQYFQLVVDGRTSGSPIFVEDQVVTTFVGSYAFATGPHLVTIAPVGPWSAPDYFDVTAIQSAFTAPRADRIHFEILGTQRQFSTEDSGQLTAWAITGLNRFSNVRAAPNRLTWGELNLTLTTDTGVHTVDCSLNGTTIFSGSRTGDGSVTLLYADGTSAGTVTLTYSADIALDDGALFVSSWPAAYYIYYKLSTDWVAGDFPAYTTYTVSAASWLAGTATLTVGAHTVTVGTSITVASVSPTGYNGSYLVTAVTGTAIKYAVASDPGAYVSGGVITRVPTAIVYDDGFSSSFAFETPPDLTPGTYHIVVHEVSDTGEESSGTTNVTQAGVHVPAAPTNFAYVSGDVSNTVISWTACPSPDTAATYNIYDSQASLVVPAIVTATHIAGAGTLTQTLAAITAGFTGYRYIVVRSLLSGVESGNSIALRINYSAGVVLIERPAAPVMAMITTVGRTLTVNWSLDTDSSVSSIVATKVQLFTATSPTGFNYAVETGHTDLSAPTTRAVFGTVSGTVAGDDEYWFAIRTNSANGQSLNVDYLGPITLSTALPADPTWSVRGGV